jgi:hypothetical protein
VVVVLPFSILSTYILKEYILRRTASIWAIMPMLRVFDVARSLRRGVEEAKDLAVMDARDLAL